MGKFPRTQTFQDRSDAPVGFRGATECAVWTPGITQDETRVSIGRLSEAVPVYAAPDQDVCGVDM